MRCLQAIILLSLACAAVRLSAGRWLHPVCAVSVLYFLALPIPVATDGLYWFSASIAYAWGILPLLIAAVCLQGAGRLTPASSLLLGCAALFHEQMAVATVIFVLLFLLLGMWQNRSPARLLRQSVLAIPTFVAASLVILAPGNFARQEASSYASESFFTIATGNLDAIGDHIVATSSGLVALTWLLASLGIYGILVGYQKPVPGQWLLWGLPSTVAGLALLSWLASWPLALMVLLTAAYGFVVTRLYSGSNQGRVIVCLYTAALASFLLLLLAPGVSNRSFTIFYLIMMVPVTHAFFEVARQRSVWMVVLVAAFLPFSVMNARTLYLGYAGNYEMNVINHYKLRALSHDLKAGVSNAEDVVLYKLADERYAATMPYQRAIIEKWLKRYYALPAALELHWR